MADVKDASRRIVFTGAAGGIGTMIAPAAGAALSRAGAERQGDAQEPAAGRDLRRRPTSPSPDEVAAAVEGRRQPVIHLGGHSA